MRFWLKWAILTLPFALCLILWIRSYWLEDAVRREGFHNTLQIISLDGSFSLYFLRDNQWNLRQGKWYSHELVVADFPDIRTEHPHLGFGYQSFPGPVSSDLATVIDVPMWFVTVLTTFPPLWLYLRHRNRRNPGFPIEPSPPNDSMTH
jgi:hypothetical protein